jgi:hypothetical protein
MGKFSELEIELKDVFNDIHKNEMSKLRNSVTSVENIYLEALKTATILYIEWRLQKEKKHGNRKSGNSNRKKSLGEKAKQLTFSGLGEKPTRDQ